MPRKAAAISSSSSRYKVPEGLLAGWVNEARQGVEAVSFEKRLRAAIERDYWASPDLNEYATAPDAMSEAYRYFKAKYGEPVRESAAEAGAAAGAERGQIAEAVAENSVDSEAAAEFAQLRVEELRAAQLREAALAEELNSSPEDIEGEHWTEGRNSHAFVEHDARFDGPRSGRR